MKRPLKSRVLSGLLALVMVLSMIPVVATAATSATWTKVELTEVTSADKIMVTMTNPSGVTYALPTAAATSYGPSAPVVTVVDDTITTSNDSDYGWTFTPATGGYIISAGGNYLNNVSTSCWLVASNLLQLNISTCNSYCQGRI